MTKNPCAPSNDTLRGAVRCLKWLFFAALICGIAPPAALLIWQTITPSVVIQRAGAGRFVSANTSSGFLQSALTTVTTTQGSLIVVGVFSAPRNQSLEIVEWSQTSGLQLCAVGRRDTCLSLAGAWAGTLEPTPARARVFNFQSHGLDRSNLGLWLFLGCAVTLMAGAGWLSGHAELEKKIRDSREPRAI